jgi:polyhydroxyalkanoate synthesis regulator protein
MEMFERAFAMFAPFARRETQAIEEDKAARGSGELDDLKRQLAEMQKRLDKLTDSEK